MTLKARFYRFIYPFHKFYRFIFRPKSIGAGCVVEFQNKILLIRNTYGDGLWSFPGGGVRKGEEPIHAAIRETKEEVGIKINSLEELGFFVYDKNYYHDTVHVFHAIVEDDAFTIDPGEILEARWVPSDSVSHGNFSNIGRKMYDIFERMRRSSCESGERGAQG